MINTRLKTPLNRRTKFSSPKVTPPERRKGPIGRNEKNGEENSRVSAFINVEAWRKNENANSFDKLTKSTMLTVEDFFKPEEWSDQEGVKHNRIVLVATKFYETPDKEETPKEEKKTSKKKAK